MKFKAVLLAIFLVFAASAQAAKTCILMGDSIMSNVAPSTIGGPTGKSMELAANRAQMEADVIIRNISSPGNSLGGSTFSFSNGAQWVAQIAGAFNFYNCVIVQAMTNDFGRNIPWQDSVAALNAIITEVKKSGRKVMVMDAIYRQNEATPNALGHTLAVYRWNIAIACGMQPDTCIWASRSGTSLDQGLPELYDPKEVQDGKMLHLNAEGHRRYADWMMYEAAKNGLF